MMDKEQQKLSDEVDSYTKRGATLLQEGHLKKAQAVFQAAHKKALQLGDAYTERACAFNLGALHIALGTPERGIEYLQRAIPPDRERDGKSNGDLYFNFGLGFETLNNLEEAVKFFELALEEYTFEVNHAMEVEVSAKAGHICIELEKWSLAAQLFAHAAKSCNLIGHHENEAAYLCHQVTSLFRCGRMEQAIEVADQCMLLSQEVKQEETLSQVYNELGLIYTQAHDFGKAAICFELALPLSRNPKNQDRKTEAVILQNLGAVYNSLGDFQRALTFHETAASLHADLGNRNSQGQCFTNLAFAYSQLGDNESAGECYLHALQAGRDTGDKHAQWQAMEGLGAVSFHQNHLNRAARYFKLALATLEASENNPQVKRRILAKIAELELGTGIQIMVNDKPRPMSRQESLELRRLSDSQIETEEVTREIREAKKIIRMHTPIALGIGQYDSESDRSLSNPDLRGAVHRSSQRHSKKKLKKRWSQRNRPGSRIVSQDEAGLHVLRTTLSESEMDPHRNRLLNGELSNSGLSDDNMRRRGRKSRRPPLLRPSEYDSEEEYHKLMQQIKKKTALLSSDDSEWTDGDIQYRERLHPPNTASDGEGKTTHKKRHRRKKMKNIDKVKQVMRDLLSFDESPSEEGIYRRQEKKPRRKYDASSMASHIKPRRSKSGHGNLSKKSLLQPEQQDGDRERLIDAHDGSGDESELDGRGDAGKGENKKGKMKDQERGEMSNSDDSSSDSDSSTSSSSSGASNSMSTKPPPSKDSEDILEERLRRLKGSDNSQGFLAPPEITLGSTYEKPIPGFTPKIPNAERTDVQPSDNYFSPHSPYQSSADLPNRAHEKKKGGNHSRDEDDPVYHDPGTTHDDPLYQTINSANRTLQVPQVNGVHENHTNGHPPPLPPRTITNEGVDEPDQQGEDMTTIAEFTRMREANYRALEENCPNHNEEARKKAERSRMCTVM